MSVYLCPKCEAECCRDEVDGVGIGVLYGPYGCPECGWSEDQRYDLSDGKENITKEGYWVDQWGGLTKIK